MTNTTKEYIEAAKLIRKELKKAFPSIKFSVKSDFSAIRVRWNNGPTYDQIDSLICKYQYGSFNGMEDIYEFDNKISGLPQVKYVFAERSISKEVYAAIEEDTRIKFDIKDSSQEFDKLGCWLNSFAGRIAREIDFLNPDNYLTQNGFKALYRSL